MCSWCWAFESTRKQLFEQLDDNIEIVRLLGGLAPDSDEPMPKQMQEFLQNTWRKIEQQVPGTRFNFDFWQQCKPRRSTYPSNRAVIAARFQGVKFDELMTHRIQQAYYTEAKNPSDNETLISLASDLGLDDNKFEQDLLSEQVNDTLMKEISDSRKLGLNSFPSLAVISQGRLTHINLDYNNVEPMLSQINALD